MTRRRWRASSRPATSACRRTAATTASPTARCRSRSSRANAVPVNTVAPSVTSNSPSGIAYTGKPLTCNHGTWNEPAGATHFTRWYRSNKIASSNPRYRAPSQLDYWNVTTPSVPQYGNQNLTWLDSQVIGTGDTYTPTFDDVGKAVHCAANVDAGGATVWKTAAAPEILFAAHADTTAGANVPATLGLSLGPAATFSPFVPGVGANYDATSTANVVSTAGNATLSVADPATTNTGQLVNGAFALPTKLQARATSAAGTGGALADVGGSANPDVAAHLHRSGQQRLGHAVVPPADQRE